MFTLRMIAITLALFAAMIVLFPVQTQRFIAQTHRELDVAIVGRGYLQFAEANSNERRYTKNGSLSVNSDGLLCIRAASTEWVLTPKITIPSDTERISILPDGKVYVLQTGTLITVGEIQLALLNASDLFEDDLILNQLADSSPPTETSPLQNGAGSLQQGWKECKTNTNTQYLARIGVSLIVAFAIDRVVTLSGLIRKLG